MHAEPPSAPSAPSALVEVSPLLTPIPTDTVWVDESEGPIRELASHKVVVDGQPATGKDIVLRQGGRCQWEMSTPEAGEYIVSLCIALGEGAPGQFGYYAGNTELISREVRGDKPHEGTLLGHSWAFRITVPAGQTRTRMFLSGDRFMFDRADIAKFDPAAPTAVGPDGQLRELAPSSYRTVLRSARQPLACIVLVPDAEPEATVARALAQRLNLKTVSEPELAAPFPAYPVRAQGVTPDTNLILLSAGRGGPLTQALRRAGWVPEDHAIPGPGGYVIRTVARPFRGQANVVIVSSSDQAGLEKGAAALEPGHDEKADEWVWNKFLVDAPGERWAQLRPSYFRIADDDPYWAKNQDDAKQPIAGIRGGGRVRDYLQRTAAFATNYWLTGNPRFAELFRIYMLKMADEKIYGLEGTADSHMQLDTILQAWDRAEECSVFSDADRLRITNYLLLQCVGGKEGFDRAHAFYREYVGPIRMRHNHQTVLGRGIMQAYEYYTRLYDLSGRGAIWKAYCDDFALNATYWGYAPENSPNYEPLTYLEQTDLFHFQGLSTKGPEGTRTWPEAMLRFAAVRDSYSLPACYGDCWDARHAASLELWEVLRDDWNWPAAQYLIDRLIRGYRVAAPDHQHASELYAYLHGSTDVGGLLPPSDKVKAEETLRPLIGLYALPIPEPYFKLLTGQIGHEQFWKDAGSKPVITPAEHSAYKVQYRSGWGFDDEYLLFETIGWTDHGNYDLGTLVQYCAGGRLWIVDHGYTNVTVEHHSTLDVKRDGKPAWDFYPNFKGRFGFFRTGSQMFDITKLDPAKSGAPGPRGAFEVVAVAPDMAGASWTRHLRGGGGAPLVVEDTLTAQEPGNYEIISRLRLLGDVSGENGNWLVKQQGATLPVTLDIAADDNAAIGPWRPDGHASNRGAYPWYPFGTKDGIPKTIEWKRTIHLDRGQSTSLRATLGPVQNP